MQRLSQEYLLAGSNLLAIKWAHRAWITDSTNVDHLYQLANCYIKAGSVEQAMRTLALAPSDSVATETLSRLAIVMRESGVGRAQPDHRPTK
jgi:thioredoxin-like negative regulator of GroEL